MNATTQTTTEALQLLPHDSTGLLYAAVKEALDGFRSVTTSPAATLAKIETAIQASKATPEIKAHAIALLATLPVAIASKGLFGIGDIVAGEVEFPEEGDAGFIISLMGFKSLELPDSTVPEGKSKRNGMWGLAIYPAHSAVVAMESESGKAWLQSLMDKESGLIAFRGMRVVPGETKIQDLRESAHAMPCLLTDYLDRSRATGETYATFNDLWPLFVAELLKNPATAKAVAALPTKRADMLAALRSTVFAEVKFPALEAAGIVVKIGRTFAVFVDTVVANAAAGGKELPYSGSDVTRWLEGRDSLDLVKAQSDIGNADDLLSALSAFGAVDPNAA